MGEMGTEVKATIKCLSQTDVLIELWNNDFYSDRFLLLPYYWQGRWVLAAEFRSICTRSPLPPQLSLPLLSLSSHTFHRKVQL